MIFFPNKIVSVVAVFMTMVFITMAGPGVHASRACTEKGEGVWMKKVGSDECFGSAEFLNLPQIMECKEKEDGQDCEMAPLTTIVTSGEGCTAPEDVTDAEWHPVGGIVSNHCMGKSGIKSIKCPKGRMFIQAVGAWGRNYTCTNSTYHPFLGR